MTTTNKTSKTSRKFYAAHHQYDRRFINDVDWIVRFDSRVARDAYVNDEKFDGSYRLEAVTRNGARSIFPEAFRLDDFRDGYTVKDVRDWTATDDEGVETFAGAYTL